MEGLEAKMIGVYAADRILNVMVTLAVIVCNTDNHTRLGSHWVAIYIDKHRSGTYFDSYGFPPVSRHQLHRLRRNCKNFRWNVKTLQSIDSICSGQYTIMFLYHMCQGISLDTFCRLFTDDTRKNDALVINNYKKIFNKNKYRKYKKALAFSSERSHGEGICNQSCIPRLRCVQ